MADQYSIKDLPGTKDDGSCFQISGKTWNALRGVLMQMWAGNHISTRGEVRKSPAGDSGFALYVAPSAIEQSVKATAQSSFPFQVTWQPKPDNPEGTTFQASIEYNSSLMKSLKPSDRQTITGLNPAPPYTEHNPKNWFDLIANDLIWLEITTSSTYTITAATIKSYGMGDVMDPTLDAWDASGDSFICNDGAVAPAVPVQTKCRVVIAQSVPDADGKPTLTQLLRTHLLMTNCAIDGQAALFPFPAPYGPYIS